MFPNSKTSLEIDETHNIPAAEWYNGKPPGYTTIPGQNEPKILKIHAAIWYLVCDIIHGFGKPVVPDV